MIVLFSGTLLLVASSVVKDARLKFLIACLVVGYILIVGWSRVYLGAHYPSDVLGGYVVGAIYLLLLGSIFRRLKLNRRMTIG
jgi:undecaprenyl-diphosphatase